MKKTISNLSLCLFLLAGAVQSVYSQCTTTTVNIDFAGAQANGCCNVCGNDYRCYTNGSPSGCTFGASFSNTFVDPVPPGNIVVSAQVNYYYSGCSGGSGTMATFLNGISVGNANFSVNNCSCGSCFFTSTPNTPFNCGIPSYNYGGNNTVSGNVSGTECIDRIQVVLCYRSSTPNAGTAAASATAVCSGQSVNLTLTGYQTGASIQWQSAPTSGGPWTNIPGATAATYASGPLSSNICYRALVTCGGNNTSNVVCITVNPPPSVSVSSATICAGQSATLTSVVNPVGGSYNWTPGGFTTSSIVVSPASTQAYNLTYTDPNGCTGTASGTVFVNTSPAITVNSPTICAGQTTTLTANGVPGGGTYLWSPSGNTSNTEVVSPSSTTTYTVQYTTGSGCSGTAVATVVVNPIPTVNVDNPTACPSTTAVINSTVSPGGGTYFWSPGGQTTPSIVVTPTAPTTYTLLYTSPAGCTNSAVSNVNVSPTPTVSVNNATICSGQSATLSAIVNPPGGTYSWTPGGFTTSSIVVSPGATQVYNLEYTNGCSTITSATVYVNPSPIVSVNSPSLCAGQSTTLTANGVPGGGTYNWNPGGATTSTLAITPPTSINYTVTYTDANSCTATAISTVIVNPIPTVAVNNATICGSGSATLVANVNPTGGLYSWSPGGMTTPTVVVSPVSTTTYNVQYIAPTGCSNTAIGIVYVSSLPTVAVNNATLCSGPGASVVLTATVSPSGGTYTWMPIGGGGPIVVVSPTSSTGYTVTYTEPGGCSASAVSYVTVLPGFSFADFTYPNHPCVDNQPYTFSATVSGSGPYAYQWYFGNGSSPSTATTLSASVNYAYSGIKYVSLVVNNLSSGCKDSIVHQVTIEDLPFVNFSASSPNCVTDTVYFNNYSWIGGSATIASWYWDFGDGNNSTAFQPSHLYSSGGTYTVYLVATSDFGCDDTLYKVVNVSPLTVAGNVTSNATVCAVSNTGTLNLNGNNGNVISWMYSTDNGLTWLPIVNTNTSYVYTNLQQTTVFGAVVQSGSCPSATTSPNATITVDAASNAGYIRRDTLICSPPNQGTLTLTNYTGSIVDWYSSTDNGVTWTALGNTSPTYTFANLLDTTQFAVIVQNGICPPDTSNAPFTTVWVRYFNSAQVVPSPDTSISIGFTVQLNAMGGYFYAWSPNYNISDTTIHNPLVWPSKDTTYMVYVVDKYGCTDVDTVRIFVQKDYKLVIANTLTPNGDNFNDFFWIGMIEYYPNNEVIVFNRYGQEIFKGNNYDNKKVYWDGTYQGNKVPDGAYYYVIKFNDNNTVFKGSINVISSH